MIGKVTGTADAASNSILQHRHFPVIVVLWFAALFGLGSLAIRPALIENAVLGMRLDTLIAAAAPPLGMTARLLLALVMGGIGAVIGLVLARRIAAPRDAGMRLRARDAHPDAPARRPLSAATDLADEADTAFDNSAPLRGQRLRSPTISEDHYPSAIIEFAPLPGADCTAPAALQHSALDLSELDLHADDAWAEPVAGSPPSAPAPSAPIAPPPEPATSAAAIAGLPLGSLSLLELTTRLASALASRNSRLAASAAVALGELVEATAPAHAEWTASAPGKTSSDDTRASEHGVSDFQLSLPPRGLARLQMQAAAADDEPAAPELAELEAATTALPDAQGYGIENAEVAERSPAHDQAGDEADEQTGEDADDGSYSSLLDISVSALSRPGHARIEGLPAVDDDSIEPVVVFPGQLARFAPLAAERAENGEREPAAGLRRFDPAGAAPRGAGSVAANPVHAGADPEATEHALRAALATLQRMSGAA